ncbi:TBP-binding domain-containing protein [Nephila pilipes]|uniref:TBP-binding domain-containing protein n=1 Tax=Nephila pilipes TaxID=299642 RepID=A0A8X6T6X5_NEPPI|nr:TBP-binding domain-containing protein [Nephila pilipes]
MDSDDEGDNERVISLTHLLFGNIDDDGHLENDFLDAESIRQLDQLRQLGIGTQLKEITDDVDSPDLDMGDYSENDEVPVKSPSAIDYSDISELAEETENILEPDSTTSPQEPVIKRKVYSEDNGCSEKL